MITGQIDTAPKHTVRSAAIDDERLGRQLARMEAREGVLAQGYEAQGRGTRSDVNGRRRPWPAWTGSRA